MDRDQADATEQAHGVGGHDRRVLNGIFGSASGTPWRELPSRRSSTPRAKHRGRRIAISSS